jgi:hypothetical protein
VPRGCRVAGDMRDHQQRADVVVAIAFHFRFPPACPARTLADPARPDLLTLA